MEVEAADTAAAEAATPTPAPTPAPAPATRRGDCYAPIKAEFRRKPAAPRAPAAEGADASSDAAPDSAPAPPAEAEAPAAAVVVAEDSAPDEHPRKKRRGMNKAKQRRQRNFTNSSCNSFFNSGSCSYGDKCKYSHDVDGFLKAKPADVPGFICPFFATGDGKCRFQIQCRLAETHTPENVRVCSKPLFDEETNRPSKELIFSLRKRKYRFIKAIEAKAMTRRENVGEPAVATSTAAVSLSVEGGEGLATTGDASCAAADAASTSAATTSARQEGRIGPVVDTERRTVDFRDKLMLAPLTTVGNLPFRRVCKGFGVDITCGEMAVATNLLQGQRGEWALLRRHECEDVFGVQVCGNHADAMSQCAEMLCKETDVDFIDINVGCPIDVVFKRGAGSALLDRKKRFGEIVRSMVHVMDRPLTVKLRTGVSDKKPLAHLLTPRLTEWGAELITLHGRSREQRYTKHANWDYIRQCAGLTHVPFYGNGDILSFEAALEAKRDGSLAGLMIGRGALYKPWLFTEIKEERHWDISSHERFEMLKEFCKFGMEHWGSDTQGVEKTRRFMLEWLSFLHRYIPVGLLEVLPQKMNERPPPYFGRDDLETLMASDNAADWVKLTEMLLGPTADRFQFVPKHKSNSYAEDEIRG